MKVIFLDIDGVVACNPPNGERMRRIPLGNTTVYALNPECVARLNRLIAETGARVVVSSTWRKLFTLEELNAVLHEAGFVGTLLSATPSHDKRGPTLYTAGIRGAEIAEWINAVENQRPLCPKPKGPAIESYVVLDDEYDNAGEYTPRGRWVLVSNGWGGGGLLDEHVAQAIEVLNRTARPLV